MAELEDFSRLTQATHFYIEESFRHAHNLMTRKLSGLIFKRLIYSIEPTLEDYEIASNFKANDPLSFLRNDEAVLTDNTVIKMADAWKTAQQTAVGKSHQYKPIEKCDGVDMLGIVTNLTFAIEVMTYRHLLYLKEIGAIDRFTYEKLEQSNPAIAIMYIFKGGDKVVVEKLDKIQYLYRLRNKAVHYTPKNAQGLAVQLSELIVIWESIVAIFRAYENVELFNEEKMSDKIDQEVTNFKNRWL